MKKFLDAVIAFFGRLLQKTRTLSQKALQSPGMKKAIPSFIAIGFGIGFGILTMAIIWLLVKLGVFNVHNDPEFFHGVARLLAGGFNRGMYSIGNMLHRAAPLILTGLSVGFAFKTGLFNIGAPGQLLFGGLVAIFIGAKVTMPAPWHWMLAALAGILAGGLWGMIVGALKSIFNVHEVVSSIMMNYIAMYFAFWAIQTFDLLDRFYDRITDTFRVANFTLTLPPSAYLPRGLSSIFGGFTINIGILIAIAAVVVIHIVLNKTTLGYQLKAAGYNRDASKYAGMNTKRDIVLSMTIAGMLAGLAGTIMILVPDKKMFMDQPTMMGEFMSIGFDGISIALLGLSEPIGVGLAGLFLAYIRQGGEYIDLAHYMKELADVITSVIIYFSALSVALHQFLMDRKKKKAASKQAPAGGESA
jgi:simple sugar transport system permease protein